MTNSLLTRFAGRDVDCFSVLIVVSGFMSHGRRFRGILTVVAGVQSLVAGLGRAYSKERVFKPVR